MKSVLVVMLMVAASLAQADVWTQVAKDTTFTLHPETIRVYRNADGVEQVDVLLSRIKTNGEHRRDRVAVTGCQEGYGDFILSVDVKGAPLTPARVWREGGDRMYDWAAERICGLLDGIRAHLGVRP
ncbi:MAG TPA: hypothetical protein VGJ72_12565 [Polaromonas sp.]|jgi:hypothetical protein